MKYIVIHQEESNGIVLGHLITIIVSKYKHIENIYS